LKFSSIKAQKKYFALALRLNAHIYAYHEKIKEYSMTENKEMIILTDKNTGKHVKSWPILLPNYALRPYRGIKKFTWLKESRIFMTCYIRLLHWLPKVGIKHKRFDSTL